MQIFSDAAFPNAKWEIKKGITTINNIGKLKKKRKSALIKPIAYNF